MVIINFGYREWRGLSEVQKPVVTIYQAMSSFVSLLPGYKTFCQRSLKVQDTKTWRKKILELTKKVKTEIKPGNITIYICNIYIYIYDIYIVYIYIKYIL